MRQFLEQHASSIMGVINGFDRLRFRGTLLRLANVQGLRTFMSYFGILLKDAGAWMEARTEELKAASIAVATSAGRPVEYIADTSVRKEAIAEEIAQRDGITNGLVCILKAVEPCQSFDIRRNREIKKLELVSRRRKCLHYYHYYQHPEFGLMHMRLQTWLPFTVWCCINGRDWLAKQLDANGIGYLKRENCLVAVSDVQRAQALADQQLAVRWAEMLNPILQQVHPLHGSRWLLGDRDYRMEYYWSCQESEWASDIMFKSPASLGELYPGLIRHGMQNLNSFQIMRFLGRKVPAIGGRFGTFAGEIVSDHKERPEGIRIKHSVNGNSIKMYDKQGSVLRIETTMAQSRDFKVFRGTEAKPDDKQWRKLRKGVVDMRRRAEVCQAANERYADALASAQCGKPLKELAEPICRPVRYGKRPVRGLNPWEREDARLLETVNRGEFTINGFRNRDLRNHLYDHPTKDIKEQRRRSAAITRKLRQLRAHGLIKKVPKTHRYVLTERGREIITSLLAARSATAEMLMKAA